MGGRGGGLRAEFIQVAVALQVKHFSPPPPVGAFSGLSMLNMNSSLILAPSEPVKVTHPRWSCTSPSWRRRGCCRGKCHPLRLSRTGDKKQSLTKYQQIHIREHRSRPPASLTVKQVNQQREPAGCQANAYHQFQTLCSPPKKKEKEKVFFKVKLPTPVEGLRLDTVICGCSAGENVKCCSKNQLTEESVSDQLRSITRMIVFWEILFLFTLADKDEFAQCNRFFLFFSCWKIQSKVYKV